jgi:four helix bundle protein
MAKGDDIEDRLIEFAVRIIKLCNKLPGNVVGKHISRQLVRSGTSPAPNYAEARGAESQKDFVHKLKVVLKELNESRVWLKMVVHAELVESFKLEALSIECNELCRVIGASIQTAKRNAIAKRTQQKTPK